MVLEERPSHCALGSVHTRNTEENIELMSSYVKTRLVKNLETLQKVYAEERLTVDKGQSIIRKFFQTKGTEQ